MIHILLVEDQEIIRRGLKSLLETKSDFKIVGEASNGQQAIELVEMFHTMTQTLDLILMDIRMPVMDGVTATQQICQKFPETRIMVLTTFDDAQYVAEALRVGAKGYLLKDTPIEELAEAIRSIDKGYTQFGPGIVEKMLSYVSVPQSKEPSLPPGMSELTAREREILCMIAQGQSNREIAQTLFLSEGTVRNHITHILTRLNLRDRTQAAIIANTFRSWLENSS